MPTLAELLGPGDRDRLTALTVTGQADAPDLVTLARQAAAESRDTGQTAWTVVAVALAAAETPDQARAALERALDSTTLRTLALACLAVLQDTE